jgi:hypothetical protein
MSLTNFFKIVRSNSLKSSSRRDKTAPDLRCAAKSVLLEKESKFAERKHASKSELTITEWVLKLVDHEYAIVVETDRLIAMAQRSIRFDRYDINVTMDTFLCMKNMRGCVAKQTNALNRIEDLQRLLVEIDSNKDDADYVTFVAEILKVSKHLYPGLYSTWI